MAIEDTVTSLMLTVCSIQDLLEDRGWGMVGGMKGLEERRNRQDCKIEGGKQEGRELRRVNGRGGL